MNFHVVIEVKNGSPFLLYSDLNKLSLNKRFVRPYKLGKSVSRGNSVLNLKEVKKVHIIKTKEILSKELQSLQKSSGEAIDKINRGKNGVVILSLGSGWQDEDILQCGEDTTNKYITCAPGEGTGLSNIIALINSPWFVRVGGGLFLSVCGYFFVKWLKNNGL